VRRAAKAIPEKAIASKRAIFPGEEEMPHEHSALAKAKANRQQSALLEEVLPRRRQLVRLGGRENVVVVDVDVGKSNYEHFQLAHQGKK